VEIEYYSQRSPDTPNDRWIVEEVLGPQRGGYFVEAGAKDGIVDSNTYTLEKHLDWEGICVEPQPDYYAGLQLNRRCRTERCALFSSSGTVEFINNRLGLGGVSETIRHPDQVTGDTIIRVPSMTLLELLEKHHAPRIIDYLSLDTEGSEFEILRVFNFGAHVFRCVTIETDDCNALLLRHGYRQVENPFNTQARWEQYFIHPSLV
jgi:FkbM family methyltransferase